MLSQCASAKELWGGVSEVIDRWLTSRQALLVEYCALSGVNQGLVANAPELRLPKLCQLLVDYVSAGHFEIYDKLMREGRKLENPDGLVKANELFATIDRTTEYVLDFNDKYLETDDLDSLEHDLSLLGEQLELRFSTEDEMMKVLHFAHNDLVN